MRIGTCTRCGAGTGRKARELCCRCWAHDREADRRAPCTRCGRFLLLGESGRCVRCSWVCVDCGGARAKTSVRCRDCRDKREREEAKQRCPRCGRAGYLRAGTGWCGPCSRPAPRVLEPRACSECERLTRRLSNGLCGRCWQRHPERARNQVHNLIASMDHPPSWLDDFATFAAERHCMGRACVMVTTVGHLIRNGETQPQALLERTRRPGRSAGALARTLEEFFVARGLAAGLDQEALLAAGRRHRRVMTTPESLRPAVLLYCDYLIRCRERSKRAGTLERSDSTIESMLAAIRDLARFLVGECAKHDWAVVQVDDIEAFLAGAPRNRQRRLGCLRQFFSWAKKNKVVLVDPTTTIPGSSRTAFSGSSLTLAEQRRLFRRWTSGNSDVHPHESLIGLLALLHALTGSELRSIRVDGIDLRAKQMALPGRPRPVPLDPVSAAAVEAAMVHRSLLGTKNPHLVVTGVTRTRSTPASSAYVTHALDAAGTRPKMLRSARLVDLVISLGPKVVGASLGMSPDGLSAYLADHVDESRLG